MTDTYKPRTPNGPRMPRKHVNLQNTYLYKKHSPTNIAKPEHTYNYKTRTSTIAYTYKSRTTRTRTLIKHVHLENM